MRGLVVGCFLIFLSLNVTDNQFVMIGKVLCWGIAALFLALGVVDIYVHVKGKK